MGDCEEKSGQPTGDTVHRAGDRAVSDIGNPPARGFPPETVRRRVNHAYERIEFPKKSRFYARQARFYSPSPDAFYTSTISIKRIASEEDNVMVTEI